MAKADYVVVEVELLGDQSPPIPLVTASIAPHIGAPLNVVDPELGSG